MRTFSPCVCYCVLKITSCVSGCRCGLYHYGLRGQRQLFDYQSGLCRMQLDQTTDAAHKLHLQQCVSLCSIDSTSASLPLLFIYFYCLQLTWTKVYWVHFLAHQIFVGFIFWVSGVPPGAGSECGLQDPSWRDTTISAFPNKALCWRISNNM